MTSARAIEYRITRNLAERASGAVSAEQSRLVEQVIAISAVAAGLLLFGSYMPELVAAAVAGSLVWALGTR